MREFARLGFVFALLGYSASAAGAPDAKSTGDRDARDVPVDVNGEKKALDSLGEGFKVKRTRHYSVIYNTTDAAAGEFATAIERTYKSCTQYTDKLGVATGAPKHKLIIYYFEEHVDYSRQSVALGQGPRDQSTPGVYLPYLNISMFYNFRNQAMFRGVRNQAEAKIAQLQGQLRDAKSSTDKKRIQDEIRQAKAQANRSNVVGGDVSEGIVQHEVSHQVLWNIGFHNPKTFLANPRWLAEGTAMMFEPISDGKSANVGRVNKERLDEYRGLERAGKLIPLRDFVTTHMHFGPATIAIAYPEAWALVHYLNRVKKPELVEYVKSLNKRTKKYKTKPEQELADFEKAFGTLDAAWEKKWKKWMEKVR